MKIIYCLIGLLISTGSIAQSNEVVDVHEWERLDPASHAELKEYRLFMKDSHTWEVQDRIAYLSKGCQAGFELGNDTMICDFSEKLGSLYREMDSTSQAFFYLNQAISYSFSPKTRQIAFNSIGGLHLRNGDYQAALDYFHQSLNEAKLLDDGSEAYPIGNISEVYSYLGDHENAIKYLKYSIEHSQKLTSPEKEYSLIYDYSFVTSNFKTIEKSDSAQKYLALTIEKMQYLDTVQGVKYQDACFVGAAAVSTFYLETKDPEKAKIFIEKTRKYAQSFYLSTVLLFEIQHALLIEDYEKAEQLFEEEELKREVNGKGGALSGKESILGLKANYYSALGEHDKVADIQRQLIEIQGERFGEARIKYTAFANVKYEMLKKNDEINSLKLDQEIKILTIQNQQYIVVLASLLALLLAGGAIFLWQQNRNRKKLGILLQEEVDSKTQDLQKTNRELVMLNHVASHDVKEPIRNIGNYVGLIQRKLPPEFLQDPDLSFFFDNTRRSIDQLYTLIEDIAKYSAMSANETIELSRIDLNELLDSLLFSLETFIQSRDGQVIYEPLPTIKSNSTILFVVLKNLIENGLKFNTSDAPTVHLSYEGNRDYHQISVIDNGIGIDPNHYKQIVEPFKRLHSRGQYQGSGIGLAIVKVLLQKLEGTLTIHSEAEKGSTFIFRLPR